MITEEIFCLRLREICPVTSWLPLSAHVARYSGTAASVSCFPRPLCLYIVAVIQQVKTLLSPENLSRVTGSSLTDLLCRDLQRILSLAFLVWSLNRVIH